MQKTSESTDCKSSRESADVTTMHATALLALLAAAQSSRALSLARPRAATKRTVLRGGSTIDAAPVKRITNFVDRNFFVCGMVASVAVAGLSPGPGQTCEKFVGKYAVATIFVLSGLGLKLSELKKAATNTKLNSLTQGANLLAFPALMLPVISLLRKTSLDGRLLDGLLVTSCLPTTVNMCVALTQASDGDVAAALTNAVIGNLLGVVVTPALVFALMQKSVQLPPAAQVARSLGAKVALPVFVGQLLRRSSSIRSMLEKRKTLAKRAQELALLSVVWCAFSAAFGKGLGVSGSDLAALLVGLPFLHVAILRLCLKVGRTQFPEREATAFAFCASHKTLAFGLPLIRTLFEGSPDLAYYCAPIMVLHPAQLFIGSLFAPGLKERNVTP